MEISLLDKNKIIEERIPISPLLPDPESNKLLPVLYLRPHPQRSYILLLETLYSIKTAIPAKAAMITTTTPVCAILAPFSSPPGVPVLVPPVSVALPPAPCPL